MTEPRRSGAARARQGAGAPRRRRAGAGEHDEASAAQVARALAASRALRDSIAHTDYVPGSPAVWAAAAADPLRTPGGLDLRAALAAAGIDRLYSHQAEALGHLAAGRNVLTVTPTASGKSLVYILPTLRELAEDPQARALYLFPYKALEQDQLAAVRGFIARAGLSDRIEAAIYDGDTSQGERRRLRASPPRVLITNPDMLHLGFLAYHEEWRELFRNLRLVVVDELHVYRGIFGSHFHHLMRRLARVCRRHGSSPRFIASSATIGNPGEFAEALMGVPFTVVERSGAPRSGQHFLFVNPAGGSPYTAATCAIEQCARAGLRTIAFTRARKITELVASWVSATAPDLMPRIASYRAGYLPAERRAIEARLSRGELLGVISTSALEHGIDIGGLDACVLIGYPGSIMSSWQRIGRVGRSDRESLVVLVALPDALDQYFMANPAQFFERSFEKAAVDPENPIIASQHLVCAGAEVPLTSADAQTYSGGTFRLVDALCRSGGLVADESGEAWYSLRRNPQRDVNLRAIGAGYSIEDADSGRAVGTVGGARAFVECHEGAIYLHQGQQFEVIEMDRERRRIVARRAERDYYTQVLSDKETEILEVLASRDASGYRVGLGRLRVTQQFQEYVRRRISDQQKISAHPLDLPPVVYETVGLWWEIPDPVREESARRGDHFMGSIHASEHAAISLFPLLTICDRNDIGGISYPAHPQLGGPAVFIYDGYPGGIGLATKGYSQIEALVQRTLALVASCPCQLGCPSCIHSPKCGSGNHPLDKAGARFVLESLARPREPGRRPARPDAARPSAAAPPTAIPAAAPPGSGIPAAAKRAAGGTGAARAPAAMRSQAVAADKSTTSAPAVGRLLFLDVETQRSAEEVGGWGRIDRMGLALAVVFDESDGAFRTYFEADVDRLIIDLLSADQVVGFNIKRFDYTVLRGYRDAAFHRIPTCDMLEVIHQRLGFRLKLGHLAETTLGEGKSADGLQSLRWYREGRLDLIEEYCRKDVDVTRRLYHFGRERGYLLYRDREQRSVRVPVDW